MTRDDRTVVKTYVPRYQKDEWVDHADALDMSQSEFLRTMVQAGRRGFDVEAEEPPSADATPRGHGLEDRVLELLRREGYLNWEELLSALTGGLEDRLDDALGRLQEEGRVRYSGRHDGYAVVGEPPDQSERPSDRGGEREGRTAQHEDRRYRERGRRRDGATDRRRDDPPGRRTPPSQGDEWDGNGDVRNRRGEYRER